MNTEDLKKLGFAAVEKAEGGLSGGAWFAMDSQGNKVVLKWTNDTTMFPRLQRLSGSLRELKSRGLPVPEIIEIRQVDGRILSVQEFLPGKSQDAVSNTVVSEMVHLCKLKVGVAGPQPNESSNWGSFLITSITNGQPDWVEPHLLKAYSKETASVLARIEKATADLDPKIFPEDELVHLDLHTDNVLIENNSVSGLIDWDGACFGDHRYDLVQYVFDLDGHGQDAWEVIDEENIEPTILQTYLAFLILKCTSPAIRHRPQDIPRQLDRARRVFDRFGM